MPLSFKPQHSPKHDLTVPVTHIHCASAHLSGSGRITDTRWQRKSVPGLLSFLRMSFWIYVTAALEGLFKEGRVRRHGLVCVCARVLPENRHVQRTKVACPSSSVQRVQTTNGFTLDYLWVIEQWEGTWRKINTQTLYHSSSMTVQTWCFGHRNFIHAKQLKSPDIYQKKNTPLTVTVVYLGKKQNTILQACHENIKQLSKTL